MNVRIKKSLPRELGLFAGGGIAYYLLEVACRGYSHWSMALCGGLCLSAIYHMNRRLYRRPLLLRAALGGGIITSVELVCGLLVNRTLHMGVWDYSDLPFNLLGQICLPFTLLWIALSLPICALCSCLEQSY